jgi:thioredoxin reductase (NADPH)
MAEAEWDVIVVGAGPAGATAALYAARANLRTLVLDKGTRAGALGITEKIANYPGVPGPISGADLVETIRRQAASFGAVIRKARVTATDLAGPVKRVFTAEGKEFTARAVILATGAMGRTQVLPGERELLGRGVSYCATCDGAFFRDQEVLVAAGSPEAADEALVLTRFARRVHVASAKDGFVAPAGEGADLAHHPKIVLHPGWRLVRIEGKDRVEAAVLSKAAGEEVRLSVQGVFIFGLGNRPITDYVAGQVSLTDGACVVVNEEMATPTPGVFACGDVLCNQVQQAVVAAAQGCIAGLAADKFLRGRTRVAKDYR